VIIDVGTTALEVARALPATFEGRVLTNSVPVAMELSGRREIELLLCGGQVRHGDGACAGAHAEAFFAEFYADRAFLGSGGSTPRPGSPAPPRGRFVLRSDVFARLARLEVWQDGRRLATDVSYGMKPDRPVRLGASWTGRADPSGGPVTVRLA